MPASTTDYNKIKEYQEAAIASKSAGAGMEGAAFTLGDKVMEAVRADRTTRGVSKLSTDVGNVMGQMVSDPNQIRTATSGMVDPFSVNALTSGARAQNLRTLGTVATQEAQNQGTIDQVIQAGANQLQARAKALYAKAEEEMAQAQAIQEEWERSMAEQEAAKKGAGTAEDNAWADLVAQWLAGLNGGGQKEELDLSDEADYAPQPIPQEQQTTPFSIWEGAKAIGIPKLTDIINPIAKVAAPGAGYFMDFIKNLKGGNK